MVEFFAGRANLSRCMRVSGITTPSLDILYPGSRKERTYATNCMDMNSTVHRDSGGLEAKVEFVKVLLRFWFLFNF